MAYLDDRFWCHPKITGLSDKAFRVHVNAIAYSSGMATGGVLTEAQQKLVGSTKKTRKELVEFSLWDDVAEVTGDPTVYIHDWKDFNGKRDERKAADRARKRRERAAVSAGQAADSPQDKRVDGLGDVRRTGRGQNVGPARVEGSEGSDGSEGLFASIGSSATPQNPNKPKRDTNTDRENLPEPVGESAVELLHRLQAAHAQGIA